jgi:hypothetical protein
MIQFGISLVGLRPDCAAARGTGITDGKTVPSPL